MADPSPSLISILFLLAIFSVQIHARESQFFSKVSAAVATPSTTTTTVNNNNAQDKTLPSKEDEELSKQDLDPAFIRDNQNGYGLYGQESTQFPTTTKLAGAPYTATTYQPYKTQNQNQESSTNYPTDTTATATTTKPNTKYYSNNAYEEEQQQNFGETSLEESGYTSTGNQNGNSYYYSGANGYSNDEKLGMSDTRYLEKGKYYYDVKNENRNLNPNQYQLQNSRNNYNTGGYYSNNNENSKYEYDNSMQKYDSQNGFGESKEEQYVP